MKEQIISTDDKDWEEARRRVATQFFDEVLVPAVEREEEITRERLEEMIASFQENNPGRESNFQPGHVLGVAFGQVLLNDVLLIQSGEPPTNAPFVEQAWELLKKLDFPMF